MHGPGQGNALQVSWPYDELPEGFSDSAACNGLEAHIAMLMLLWGINLRDDGEDVQFYPDAIPPRRSWAPTASPIHLCDGQKVPRVVANNLACLPGNHGLFGAQGFPERRVKKKGKVGLP